MSFYRSPVLPCPFFIFSFTRSTKPRFTERTVELAADAHKHLERDELIFRELGERVGADADLARKFRFI